jgi:hypothetical protein
MGMLHSLSHIPENNIINLETNTPLEGFAEILVFDSIYLVNKALRFGCYCRPALCALVGIDKCSVIR